MPNTPKKTKNIPSAKAAISELETMDSKASTPRSHSSVNPAQSNRAAPAKAGSQLSSSSRASSNQPLSDDDKLDIFLARAYDGNGFSPEKLKELKEKNEDEQGGPSKIEKIASRPTTPSPQRSRFNLFTTTGVSEVTDSYMTSKAASHNTP